MSRMEWHKEPNSARRDARLKQLTGDEFRVWFNLRCLASEVDHEGGAIAAEDTFTLAWEVADGDEGLLCATLEKLERLRLVTRDNETITLCGWAEVQARRPSDKPEATRLRKQQQRERQKVEMSRDVTRDIDVSRAGHDNKNKNLDQEKEVLTTPPYSPPRNGTERKEKLAAMAKSLPKRTDPLLEYFEAKATDMLRKSLSNAQRDLLNEMRNKHGERLTVEFLDSAFAEAARYSGEKLAYVFAVIENQLSGKVKPSKNGTNGNGHGSEEIPPDGYSWDRHNGEWVHKGGLPGYGLPYRARNSAEVEERDEREWEAYRRRRNSGS